MSDTVTITLDDRERLREIARLIEVDSGRDDAQRDARFLHRFAERPAQPPEHSQVPSVLGDEDRERLRDIALRIELAVKKGDIPEVANLDAQYLRRLAEHPSSSEAGLRETIHSAVRKWSNQPECDKLACHEEDEVADAVVAALEARHGTHQ